MNMDLDWFRLIRQKCHFGVGLIGVVDLFVLKKREGDCLKKKERQQVFEFCSKHQKQK